MQDARWFSIQVILAWQYTAKENQSSKGREMRMVCGNWDMTTHRWWASCANITTVQKRPHWTLSSQTKLLRMCTVSLWFLGWSYTCTQQQDFQQNPHGSKQLQMAITNHGRELPQPMSKSISQNPLKHKKGIWKNRDKMCDRQKSKYWGKMRNTLSWIKRCSKPLG